MPKSRGERALLAVGLWSLLFWTVWTRLPRDHGLSAATAEAGEAAEIMSRAVEAIQACRESSGTPIDARTDLNRTGLIGVEESPITTSLGQLEAKRTTANPNFAAGIVRLFREAGVRRGETIALGASSSFPGLILAVLAASRAMALRPLLIVSLGASNWGANIPEWTWLEMADCLRKAGIIDVSPLAVSVGGEGDEGRDMSSEGRAFLREKIRAGGFQQILEPDLPSDVRTRMDLFERTAAGAPIKAFVNVGGSWVNMGTDADVLKLRPGVNREMTIPPPEKRGLIQEMAVRKIPVIHLLYVKGLAERFGLPWDPVPLPRPGEGLGPARPRAGGTVRTLVLGLYLAGVLAGAGLFLIDKGDRIFTFR